MNLFSTIKQQLSLLDIISEYVPLKKAGTYYKGCCPFHHERSASFTVTPHKEIFYCFGCHAGGDVISFIAKIEHCSALEAARHLVERYSIKLPETISWDQSTDSYEAKKSYHKTCDVFARWCSLELKKYEAAHQYLLNRSCTEESIKAFSLGYCPATVKSLLAFGQKDGILAQNFLDAHIIKESKVGLYLAFDERIIFPIKDHLGSIVGFGGRVFTSGDERAKYYNSQEHAHFNKGTLLYGLDRAKKVIAQEEAVFLVEGYTDLIIMHQYGYTNTVATLGTACTLDHLKQLARYAHTLYLMYDGDAAGQNAIMRLVELCWEVSIDPYVITLPPEDDPASYLQKEGSLEKPFTNKLDIFSFVVKHLSDDFNHKSLQDKLAVAQRTITIIRGVQDPLKQDLLFQQAHEAFNIPLETLKKSRPTVRTAPAKPELEKQSSLHKTPDLIKRLFSGILTGKTPLKETDSDLVPLLLEAPLQELFIACQTVRTDQGTDIARLFEQLTEEEKAFISQCMTIESEALPPEQLTLLYKKQWKKKIHDVTLRVVAAEQQGDKAQIAQLLTGLNALKSKMLERGIL